ncbi:NAD-dependent epimerase/dehydratase family protein [Myxococcota bacterium]|nr:NAD-dependent epimerase/dehydratase family protein [Myxococcota bacterium]MBU1429682.1 NAD-dependent epimerase/dehydratase family protein [Myxococcota bacterium]MBU1896928.1 NAD-dependent epimerase/dehydratase family protein [Myxococcota bacterium]
MPDIRGKKILVIGGAGFIGGHIVEQLLAEDIGGLIVYDNLSRGRVENIAAALDDPRARLFEIGGDVLHLDHLDEAVKEADMVIHLAALWLLHCHDYPRSAFKVNIEGTFNVLEACRHHGIERLVYSSSASVYGNALEEPMTEAHPFNNDTFYGATKIAGEAMLHAFHQRYGLNAVGLRYMNVYGPRQDDKGAYIAVIMRFLERIAAGQPLQLAGDGSQAYDFVYVGDVARANLCALKAKATDAFYNVGTGQATSIAELARLLLEITGSGVGLAFSDQIQSFVTRRVGSTDKAAAELGFTAQVTLREGLERLYDWWCNR